jgi:predicted nuclease of restriction endonuclease-like RecB superfamily
MDTVRQSGNGLRFIACSRLLSRNAKKVLPEDNRMKGVALATGRHTIGRESSRVGNRASVPDFSFTHRKDGRRALLEIVGFWHPHYLRRKLTKVRQAGRRDLSLLVYESANLAEGEFEAASVGEVLTFTRKPILKEVLAAVERCAVPPGVRRRPREVSARRSLPTGPAPISAKDLS